MFTVWKQHVRCVGNQQRRMLGAMMATTIRGSMNGIAAKHGCSSTAQFKQKPCRGTPHELHTWGPAQHCSNISWLAPLRLLILVRVPNAFQSVVVDSLLCKMFRTCTHPQEYCRYPNIMQTACLLCWESQSRRMLDAMMATTVHGSMNGSAAKHVCSSTAEFNEKPC